MEEKDLKIALENFTYYVKALERVDHELEELNTKRFKVGGSIVKIPKNPKSRELVMVENLEKLEKLQKKHDYYFSQVSLVNEFIDSLDDSPENPIRSIVIDKYVNRLSTQDLELKYHMDRKTIWRKIENNIQSDYQRTYPIC